ncbi:N-acetylglucosamine kinase 1 [Recurvomyces mirabilis]|uniref:Phosphotransferase n=1 Tax=Recurvomyces mirabilis TaxID=574656 RepID=A0AAE0WWV0_9PEZI|nr:N-acetylglucosamine kinase 1 [Recurvomyces mirabilis]KAK5158880.1 N-acetylglucosamine kinase 1 [Recurvomyces mirabilis]
MSVLISSGLDFIRNGHSMKRKREHHVVERAYEKSMEEFSTQTRDLLAVSCGSARLLEMSERIREEYLQRLQSSDISMLPSYLHTLPTGTEQGDFLALDVGGSTFRIAVIRLTGKRDLIRDLKGQAFFDWMAERIGELLAEYNHMKGTTNARLQMGLAWSFPIEQTSPRSGRLLAMGKGFCATHGVEGQDLSELIMRSCRARHLNVEMMTIVNDGTATLLSKAYLDRSTRMSLILGTGTNAAVFLPTTALGKGKFGERPQTWHDAAERVLVNTEVSMFGRHVLPRTRWDDELNKHHVLPDFQPLEYMITGRYLGEIVRLILVEAVTTAGLFDGDLPEGLNEPYTLDTRLLAAFEQDTSRTLIKASASFLRAHALPTPPRLSELEFLRETATLVSRRAATYLATALHALWRLRTTAEGLRPGEASHVTIACDGTIIEKYPEFRTNCQAKLDELCALSGAAKGTVSLAMAPESSLFGAAVAVACIDHP